MAMQHIEGCLRELGESDLAEDIALKRKQFARRGHGSDIPLPTQEGKTGRASARPQEVTPAIELDLAVEWQRQSQKFLELGFHKEIGYPDTDEGRQAYLDSLPKFEVQPKEYRGRFDLPLLVETRIPWTKQAQLAGISISDYLQERVNQTRPWSDGSQTPGTPYSGWFTNWGQRFTAKITPFDARKQLKQDECGAGLFEGITMGMVHPEFTRSGQYFDLIGCSVESDYVVDLLRWYGGPMLFAGLGDGADADGRPLVRGSKIVTR